MLVLTELLVCVSSFKILFTSDYQGFPFCHDFGATLRQAQGRLTKIPPKLSRDIYSPRIPLRYIRGYKYFAPTGAFQSCSPKKRGRLCVSFINHGCFILSLLQDINFIFQPSGSLPHRPSSTQKVTLRGTNHHLRYLSHRLLILHQRYNPVLPGSSVLFLVPETAT